MIWLLPCGYSGPKDRWQTELEKVSRSGLLHLVHSLAFVHCITRDDMVKAARSAKTAGSADDAHKAYMRFMADPGKAIDESIRRARAAKKAARRRKRSAR